MQLPGSTSSSATYLAHGEYLLGSAEAWSGIPILTSDQQKAIEAVAGSITAEVTKLRDAAQVADNAERTLRKARARFGACDVYLDLRVMGASDALLNGPALRSREHPIYLQVFQGTTASALTRTPSREQPEIVQRVLEQLKVVADFQGKEAAVENLTQALNASLSARDALEAAEQAANTAGDAELNARLALRTALEQSYGNLRATFAGQRDFVESMFMK